MNRETINALLGVVRAVRNGTFSVTALDTVAERLEYELVTSTGVSGPRSPATDQTETKR